jgi:hypothetical protein
MPKSFGNNKFEKYTFYSNLFCDSVLSPFRIFDLETIYLNRFPEQNGTPKFPILFINTIKLLRARRN